MAKTVHDSCAIAKMTAQCALYMGALNIYGTPWLRPRLLFPTFFSCAFLPIDPMNVPTKFEVRIVFTCFWEWDNRGYPKICTVSGYAYAPFSPNFLMGFYSDWPCKYTRQIWSSRIALPISEIIEGTRKIRAVPGYAHAPFSPKFLLDFYSDWYCKCTHLKSVALPVPGIRGVS